VRKAIATVRLADCPITDVLARAKSVDGPNTNSRLLLEPRHRVYSSHLLHSMRIAKLGQQVQLCTALWPPQAEPFLSHGTDLGLQTTTKLGREYLAFSAEQAVGGPVESDSLRTEICQRIGVVTGGGERTEEGGGRRAWIRSSPAKAALGHSRPSREALGLMFSTLPLCDQTFGRKALAALLSTNSACRGESSYHPTGCILLTRLSSSAAASARQKRHRLNDTLLAVCTAAGCDAAPEPLLGCFPSFRMDPPRCRLYSSFDMDNPSPFDYFIRHSGTADSLDDNTFVRLHLVWRHRRMRCANAILARR